MCADFVCLHVLKNSKCTKKENPQAAVRIFIREPQSSLFHQTTLPKGPVFVVSLQSPWPKGFVRCVRNARSPFVALSLRVVATMCALALVGQGDRFCHFKGPISNSCCCPPGGSVHRGFTRHVLWPVQAATDVERPCVNP